MKSMSADKVETLEKEMYEMKVMFSRMETTLLNIEKNISFAMSARDVVTTHTEQLKNLENKIIALENNDREKDRALNSINLKIAGVSGAWTVAIFILSKI